MSKSILATKLEKILKDDKVDESTPEVLKNSPGTKSERSSDSSSSSSSDSDSGDEHPRSKVSKQPVKPQAGRDQPAKPKQKKRSDQEHKPAILEVMPEIEAELSKLKRWLATKRYANIVKPYRKQIEKLVKHPGEAGIDELKFMTQLLRDKTGVNSDVSPDDAADSLLKGLLPPALEILKMAGYDYTCFLPEWQKSLPNYLTLTLIKYPINTGGVNPLFPLIAAIAAPIAIKTWNDIMREQAKAALEEKIKARLQQAALQSVQQPAAEQQANKADDPTKQRPAPSGVLLPGQQPLQEPKTVSRPPIMPLEDMEKAYAASNK